MSCEKGKDARRDDPWAKPMNVRSLNKLYTNVRSGAQYEKTSMNDFDHSHWLSHLRVGRPVWIEHECWICISVNHDVRYTASVAGSSGEAFRVSALLRWMGSDSTSKIETSFFRSILDRSVPLVNFIVDVNARWILSNTGWVHYPDRKGVDQFRS